jgi:plasmid stabilization system protein ParE
MKSYWLTPAAEDDLFEIWSYIAADNCDALTVSRAISWWLVSVWPSGLN